MARAAFCTTIVTTAIAIAFSPTPTTPTVTTPAVTTPAPTVLPTPLLLHIPQRQAPGSALGEHYCLRSPHRAAGRQPLGKQVCRTRGPPTMGDSEEPGSCCFHFFVITATIFLPLLLIICCICTTLYYAL